MLWVQKWKKESTEANRKKNQKILKCPEYFQIENI